MDDPNGMVSHVLPTRACVRDVGGVVTEWPSGSARASSVSLLLCCACVTLKHREIYG